MTRLIGGSNLLTGPGDIFLDDDRSMLWDPCYGQNYQNRGSPSWPNWNFFSTWPASRMSAGNPNVPVTWLGGDSSQVSNRQWLFSGSAGKTSPVFIAGQCLNSVGAILAGATVLGFRQSDKRFVGQTTSDANGNYSIGSPYPSVNHFIVAYLAGSPDVAGTTVNNLVPS
jgi:hypothetical protein